MTITNDTEFRAILSSLSASDQRKVAAAFVNNVLPLCTLCKDARLSTVVSIAERAEVTEQELAAAYQLANAVRVESFCRCGQEVDWHVQVRHFVSKSALNCVKPVRDGVNLAWDAAMDARIARTCESIASGSSVERQEAEAQYRILSDFMNQQGGA